MGYRSDVRIVTSKRGYNELKKSIQDYYKENDIPKDYQFDLLNNTNVMEMNKYQVYLGWNNIKWYGYPDVDAIEDGLSKLKDKDLSYRFARLGENYDDYEEHSHESLNDKEQDLDYPSMERYFDDDSIIDRMKEIKKREESRDR